MINFEALIFDIDIRKHDKLKWKKNDSTTWRPKQVLPIIQNKCNVVLSQDALQFSNVVIKIANIRSLNRALISVPIRAYSQQIAVLVIFLKDNRIYSFTHLDYTMFKNRAIWNPLLKMFKNHQEAIKRQAQEKRRFEQQRIAAQKAEQQRLVAQKAEQQRFAVQKAEQQRFAVQKAEQQRIVAQKAEQQRLVAQKAKQQRMAAQKAEQQRLGEINRIAEHKRQKEQEIIDEKKRLEKLSKMLKVYTKIKKEEMRKILNMKEDVFNDRLLDWALEYGFKIDGNMVLLENADVQGFISGLDNQFSDWKAKETSKDGKIEDFDMDNFEI
jgi:flagellar biosynthesis GTPase FlhF